MTGASSSVTVTVKLHSGPTGLVQVTCVSPTGKKEPEGWSHVTMPQPAPEGSVYVTFAPHSPGSFDTLMSSGHERLHSGWSSKAPMSVPSLVAALVTPGSSYVRDLPRWSNEEPDATPASIAG